MSPRESKRQTSRTPHVLGGPGETRLGTGSKRRTPRRSIQRQGSVVRRRDKANEVARRHRGKVPRRAKPGGKSLPRYFCNPKFLEILRSGDRRLVLPQGCEEVEEGLRTMLIRITFEAQQAAKAAPLKVAVVFLAYPLDLSSQFVSSQKLV